MRKRISLVFLAAFFFSVLTPAYGFFEVFDELKEKLNTETGAGSGATAGLEKLVEELNEIAGPTFTDIPEDAWYKDEVETIASWKIAEGYKDASGELTGAFGPADHVTIAEFLKMALKAAKVNEEICPATATQDQWKSHWAYVYLSCAVERNFRFFREGQSIDLNKPATRAEVLVLLHDAFGDELPPFPSPFKDTMGHAYELDIAYANFRGVVTGDTDAKGNPTWHFRPDDRLNRAEAAKIIFEQLKSIILAEQSGDSVTVDIVVKNHSFTPNVIKVKRGQFVTLRFRITGIHTFSSPTLLMNTLLDEPNEKVSFYASDEGSYPFQCAVEGHKEKGMEGVIIIE